MPFSERFPSLLVRPTRPNSKHCSGPLSASIPSIHFPRHPAPPTELGMPGGRVSGSDVYPNQLVRVCVRACNRGCWALYSSISDEMRASGVPVLHMTADIAVGGAVAGCQCWCVVAVVSRSSVSRQSSASDPSGQPRARTAAGQRAFPLSPHPIPLFPFGKQFVAAFF